MGERETGLLWEAVRVTTLDNHFDQYPEGC